MHTPNKYVLITGGSQGIGLELAKVFAKNGHNLILVARHKSELNEAKTLLQDSGVDVITIAKDLFNQQAAFDLYQHTKDMNIEVEILVNNAGQGIYGLFEDTSIERELAIVSLNISSLIILTKLYLQDMLDAGSGRILNLSSVASKSPGPWQSVYHGTKAFVQSFSEALRSEVKEKNIVVTALLPGATDTDFFNKANMNASKVVEDKEKLADPATVAEDGYKALMNNEDMVVSGFKNKVTVAINGLMSDRAAADNMKNYQEPSGYKK